MELYFLKGETTHYMLHIKMVVLHIKSCGTFGDKQQVGGSGAVFSFCVCTAVRLSLCGC